MGFFDGTPNQANPSAGLGTLGPVGTTRAPMVLPDDVRRRLDMADALTRDGLSYAPIASPWQGAARLADVLAGNSERSQAAADRQTAIDGVNQTFSQLLTPNSTGQGGMTGQGGTAGQGSAPLHPLAASLLADPASTDAGVAARDAMRRNLLSQTLLGGDPDKNAFVNTYLPMAQQASATTGIDPRLILGQAAQETGWGAHQPGNNLFGLKGPGQVLPTSENIDGQSTPTQASFQTFAQPSDSFAGYSRFINANPRYQALQHAQGLDAQLAALGQSGYASDPAYAAKVGTIARNLPMPAQSGSPADAGSGIGGGGSGSPTGGLGAPTGGLGAPAGSLGAPAGSLGAPAGSLGAPASASGAPTGGLGAPADNANAGPGLTNATLAPPAAGSMATGAAPVSAGGTLPGTATTPAGTMPALRQPVDPTALLSVMTNPWASPQQQQIAGSLYAQQTQRGRFSQYRDQDGSLFQRDLTTGEDKLLQDNHAKSPDIEGYRYARATGFAGSFTDYILSVKKAQAPQLQMNTGPAVPLQR